MTRTTCANCGAPAGALIAGRWCVDCVRMALKTTAAGLIAGLFAAALQYGLAARHAVTAWLCR